MRCSGVVSLYKEKARFGGEVFLFHADRESLAQVVRQQLLTIDPEAKRSYWLGGRSNRRLYRTGCLGMAFTEK